MTPERRKRQRFGASASFDFNIHEDRLTATSNDISTNSAYLADSNVSVAKIISLGASGLVDAQVRFPGGSIPVNLERIEAASARPGLVVRFSVPVERQGEFLEALLTGQVLAEKFRIDRTLGRGSTGPVFLARDMILNREVALKVISTDFFVGSADHDHLLNEARAASRIEHHNVVRVHSADQAPGIIYVVMEHVAGQTLREIMNSPLSYERIASLACQILVGLASAHEQSVIHRDIKPENIMITTSGVAKILDFGIAKVIRDDILPASLDLGARDAYGLAESSSVVGTIAYMSPEQAEARPIDNRSDLFSFGVVLYELLFGERPFRGDSTQELFSSILIHEVTFPSVEYSPLALMLREIAERCLHKEPSGRYSSAWEILEILRMNGINCGQPASGQKGDGKSLERGRFGGECLYCGEPVELFPLEPEGRLCTRANCARDKWPGGEHSKLVTILPRWKEPVTLSDLPHILQNDLDLFARFIGNSEGLPKRTRERELAPPYDGGPHALFPYRRDYLASYGLSCGTPICFRHEALETWSQVNECYVLDLSQYHWSHTLKDPKSWAVVNVAIERGMRFLSTWTAGNAGLSLATLCRAANKFLEKSRTLRVYALFGGRESRLDDYMKIELRKNGCELIETPSDRILNPLEIRRLVAQTVSRAEWDPARYWEVTDGWDGVGSIMYRILFCQVLRDLEPEVVIAPVGTGNLIVGILQAIEDFERSAPSGPEISCVGAIPAGVNILEVLEKRLQGKRIARQKGQRPEMPKIAGEYTPLLPIIERALASGRLKLRPVNLDEQKRAGAFLLGGGRENLMMAEPSALAPFGCLASHLKEELVGWGASRVLLVNSGAGLCSTREQRFIGGLLR